MGLNLHIQIWQKKKVTRNAQKYGTEECGSGVEARLQGTLSKSTLQIALESIIFTACTFQ